MANTNTRCFFVNCKNVPLVYCCGDHIPGSKATDVQPATSFYTITPLPLEERHAIARKAAPSHSTRKALRDATLAVGRRD